MICVHALGVINSSTEQMESNVFAVFRVWSATLYCKGTSFPLFGIRNRWSSWLPEGDRRKCSDNRLTAHSEERGAVTRGITRVLSLNWMVLEVYVISLISLCRISMLNLY